MKRFLIVFAAVANLVLVDAVVKEIAGGCLKGSAAISVIPGLFNLAYVENRGCAWGLFQGQVWPLAVFGLVALAFLIWKRKAVFGLETKDARREATPFVSRLSSKVPFPRLRPPPLTPPP